MKAKERHRISARKQFSELGYVFIGDQENETNKTILLAAGVNVHHHGM